MIQLECMDCVAKLWKDVVAKVFSKRLPSFIKVILFIL